MTESGIIGRYPCLASIEDPVAREQLRRSWFIQQSAYLPHRPDYDIGLRAMVSKIRKLNLRSDSEVERYLSLLQDYRNCAHFTGIYKKGLRGRIEPITPEEFKEDISGEDLHPLAGINVYGEIIGYATIHDPGRGQRDTFIDKVIVVNDLQGQEKGNSLGTGASLLDKVIEFAFSTKNSRREDRTKLDAAVVMKVPGWDAADSLFVNRFHFVSRLEDQAEVYLPPDPNLVVMPTMRFEIIRKDWEIQRHWALEHNVPQQTQDQ